MFYVLCWNDNLMRFDLVLPKLRNGVSVMYMYVGCKKNVNLHHVCLIIPTRILFQNGECPLLCMTLFMKKYPGVTKKNESIISWGKLIFWSLGMPLLMYLNTKNTGIAHCLIQTLIFLPNHDNTFFFCYTRFWFIFYLKLIWLIFQATHSVKLTWYEQFNHSNLLRFDIHVKFCYSQINYLFNDISVIMAVE